MKKKTARNQEEKDIEEVMKKIMGKMGIKFKDKLSKKEIEDFLNGEDPDDKTSKDIEALFGEIKPKKSKKKLKLRK